MPGKASSWQWRPRTPTSVIRRTSAYGTKNNATVVDPSGRFLVDALVETPSRVREGPHVVPNLYAGRPYAIGKRLS